MIKNLFFISIQFQMKLIDFLSIDCSLTPPVVTEGPDDGNEKSTTIYWIIGGILVLFVLIIIIVVIVWVYRGGRDRSSGLLGTTDSAKSVSVSVKPNRLTKSITSEK